MTTVLPTAYTLISLTNYFCSSTLSLLTQAFPDTPWAFIYRQPIQTMMSHLDPLKGSGGGAPCLRSMRDPPVEVR